MSKSYTRRAFSVNKKIQATLANCLDFCETFNRAPHFYITGGDPILHKNFWQLLEIFRANNFQFTIMGNPFHLDDETCAKLKFYGCAKYQMSPTFTPSRATARLPPKNLTAFLRRNIATCLTFATKNSPPTKNPAAKLFSTAKTIFGRCTSSRQGFLKFRRMLNAARFTAAVIAAIRT